VFGGIFNRTLLRRVLQPLPVKEERFACATWRQADPCHVGWIEGIDGSWIIGVMPLNPDTTKLSAAAPAFPSPEVAP
jgi:hypothetical protein